MLERALTQVPDRWRSKKVLIRADGAGYSHALITALSQQGLDFSVGYPVTEAVRDAIGLVPERTWTTANNADGGIRGHAESRGGHRHARSDPLDRHLSRDAGHRAS